MGHNEVSPYIISFKDQYRTFHVSIVSNIYNFFLRRISQILFYCIYTALLTTVTVLCNSTLECIALPQLLASL